MTDNQVYYWVNQFRTELNRYGRVRIYTVHNGPNAPAKIDVTVLVTRRDYLNLAKADFNRIKSGVPSDCTVSLYLLDDF